MSTIWKSLLFRIILLFITSFAGKRMSHPEIDFAMSYFHHAKNKCDVQTCSVTVRDKLKEGTWSQRFVLKCVFVFWENLFAHGGFTLLLFSRISACVSVEVVRLTETLTRTAVWSGLVDAQPHGIWPGWGSTFRYRNFFSILAQVNIEIEMVAQLWSHARRNMHVIMNWYWHVWYVFFFFKYTFLKIIFEPSFFENLEFWEK